jgi:hypothetical protein
MLPITTELRNYIQKTDSELINKLIIEIVEKILFKTLFEDSTALAGRNYKIFLTINRNLYTDNPLYTDYPKLSFKQVSEKFSLSYQRTIQIYDFCCRQIYKRINQYSKTNSIYMSEEECDSLN